MNRDKFSNSDYSNIKNDMEVTIIIAAYLRYDSLNLALQSVYKQTYKNWNVLIIADNCDDNFIKNVDLADSRVRLINLPKRCGNQYGPNSVGIHMATTEYIAFLNHDDLWLSDHLETAINTMKNKSSNFFIGSAVTCYSEHQEFFNNQKRLHFSEENNPQLIWRSIYGPNEYFEPVSSWVLQTKLAKKVGYWFAPDKIIKTPLMDWLSRAARAKSIFSYSNKVTTLKFNLHPFLSKPRLYRMIYALQLYKILSKSILNFLLRIENRLIIWFSYLLFPIKTAKSKTNPIRTQSKYLSKDIDLEKVKFYLKSKSCDSRSFIKNDVNEACKIKILTKNKSIQSLVRDKAEQQRINSFHRYIATGIIDQKQKNKMIYSSKYFKSLLYDRTGEQISKFIPPETIIDELIQHDII